MIKMELCLDKVFHMIFKNVKTGILEMILKKLIGMNIKIKEINYAIIIQILNYMDQEMVPY